MLSAKPVAACLFVALISSACVPPEEIEPLAKDYPATTAMGAIQEDGVVRVGLPGVPELDSFAGALGQEFADLLGVRLEAVEVAPDEVHLRLDDGTIDLAFPMKPLAEQVVRRNTVTDPYLVVFQRVLGPAEVDPAQIAGEETCVVGDPALTVAPERSRRAPASGCLEWLLTDRFKAITGFDVELVALQAEFEATCREAPIDFYRGCSRRLQIGGDQLAVAGLSVFVERGASEMVAFVERAIDEYIADGSWLASWSTVYGTYLDEPRPPSLTAEEAAALYPAD